MEVGRLEALLLSLRVHCGNLRRGGGMLEMQSPPRGAMREM